jgi:hypothetical protein
LSFFMPQSAAMIGSKRAAERPYLGGKAKRTKNEQVDRPADSTRRKPLDGASGPAEKPFSTGLESSSPNTNDAASPGDAITSIKAPQSNRQQPAPLKEQVGGLSGLIRDSRSLQADPEALEDPEMASPGLTEKSNAIRSDPIGDIVPSIESPQSSHQQLTLLNGEDEEEQDNVFLAAGRDCGFYIHARFQSEEGMYYT